MTMSGDPRHQSRERLLEMLDQSGRETSENFAECQRLRDWLHKIAHGTPGSVAECQNMALYALEGRSPANAEGK